MAAVFISMIVTGICTAAALAFMGASISGVFAGYWLGGNLGMLTIALAHFMNADS